MLGNRIDNILRLMRYLSHAPAAKAPDSPYITRGEAEYAGPRDVGQTLYERWIAEDSELSLLVLKMEQELKRATHSPRSTPEHAHEFAARVVKEHKGVHYAVAAKLENVHPTYIRKIRVKAGVPAQYGVETSELAA